MGEDIGQISSLSIIVPAYKAERFIVPSITKVEKVVSRITKDYEVICVVDGMVDATYDRAMRLAKNNAKIKVVGYSKNRGKGFAVRYGLKRAKGHIVGFIDAGLEIDPSNLRNLLRVHKAKGANVVVGSKRHPESKIKYPLGRRIMSLIYWLWVKLLFNPGLTDTQAGIKIFERKVVGKILPRLKINEYSFDIEMIMEAKKAGFEVREAPIVVRHLAHEESTISGKGTIKTSLKMFYDTLAYFLRT